MTTDPRLKSASSLKSSQFFFTNSDQILTTAWTNSGQNMILVLKKLNRFCSKSISEVTLSLPPICEAFFTACQIAIEASNLKKNNWRIFFSSYCFYWMLFFLILSPTVLLQFVFCPQNCRPMWRLHLKRISTIWVQKSNLKF